MSQTREKWDSPVLSRGNFEWYEGAMVLVTFKWYESAMAFRVFIFIFCLETTVRENNWMGTTSATVTVFFFEGVIPKVLDHSYVQSSFSIITRHPYKSIWKTLYNCRFYGHGST